MQSCCGFLPSFRTAGLCRSPSLNSYTLSSWILVGLEFSLLLLHMVLKMEEEVVDLDRVDKAGPLDEILRLWKELE